MSTAADDGKAGCWLHAPVVQGKDAAAEVTGLNSMTKWRVNNAWISRGSVQFPLVLFFLLLFYFILLLLFFCLISVFWPHPGEPSAFDFSLYGYMVNFLSHSSEMETFNYYIYTFITFFHCSSCCLLFIAESEARLKGWQLLGLFRPFE